MNPFIYKNFKADMTKATKKFVENSDYKIINLGDSSLVLSNEKMIIEFYLDGPSIMAIYHKPEENEKSLYDLFVENGVEKKYPFDKVNKYAYEEWNKYKVKKILGVLSSNLRALFN